jgi:pilus assembly protein Flp/PilA
MPQFIRKLVRESHGATAIEYGLIAALIAVGAISGFNAFGNGLTNMWGNIENNVLASS